MPALSYTTALGGGIIRDLLIGVTPPATFTDSRYLIVPAVGGGIMRDVLVREVPLVLHREIYATAALIGATIVAVGDRVSWAPTPVAVAGVLATFAIRVISKCRGWSAPIAQER